MGAVFSWRKAPKTPSARNTLIALNAVSAGGAGGTNFFAPVLYFGQPPPPPEPPEVGLPGTNGIGLDVAGPFTSERFNLVGVVDGSTGFTDHVRGDQIGTAAAPLAPRIGPLQMNGGPTPTHALLPGSPAVNQGLCFGVHTNQRGLPRPVLFPGIPKAAGGDGTDIGAFELQTP